MLLRDITKEHTPREIPKSMQACLIARQPVKVIQPIPNSMNKRVRRMEINRYAGLDEPVVIVLSDEETADETETDKGAA